MSRHLFVHMSDIHFGQEHDGNIIPHNDVKNEALFDCQALRRAIRAADGVIVTGDVVFSGKQVEFEAAGNWLDRLCSTVGCETHSVFCIPGNHDIDLAQMDTTSTLVHDWIRKAPSQDLDKMLVGLAESSPDPLLPKFKPYQQFAARYGCDFDSLRKSRWQKDLPALGGNHLRFTGMNGVRISDRNDTHRSLILGNDQYTLEREHGCEYVVLLHHPLNWFRDFENAAPMLRRARVILLGHEHERSIQLIEEFGEQRLEIHAGALIPDQVNAKYHYRYNWLEFDSRVQGDTYSLQVTIWSRVWNPELTKFTADTTLHQTGISSVYQMRCPQHFRFDEASNSTFSGAATECGDANTPEEVTQMNDATQNDFERLRYYYWRYLTPQQRLQVLADLEILPAVADKALPQTLEQLALDMAKSARKLAPLWSAIMQHVPDADRKPNPFQHNTEDE